jgi:hypothetical protein
VGVVVDGLEREDYTLLFSLSKSHDGAREEQPWMAQRPMFPNRPICYVMRLFWMAHTGIAANHLCIFYWNINSMDYILCLWESMNLLNS